MPENTDTAKREAVLFDALTLSLCFGGRFGAPVREMTGSPEEAAEDALLNEEQALLVTSRLHQVLRCLSWFCILHMMV